MACSTIVPRNEAAQTWQAAHAGSLVTDVSSSVNCHKRRGSAVVHALLRRGSTSYQRVRRKHVLGLCKYTNRFSLCQFGDETCGRLWQLNFAETSEKRMIYQPLCPLYNRDFDYCFYPNDTRFNYDEDTMITATYQVHI